MTTVFLAALLVAILAFAVSSLVLVAQMFHVWRGDRRWQRERERLTLEQERMAAHNGRPHSEAIIHGATRRDP